MSKIIIPTLDELTRPTVKDKAKPISTKQFLNFLSQERRRLEKRFVLQKYVVVDCPPYIKESGYMVPNELKQELDLDTSVIRFLKHDLGIDEIVFSYGFYFLLKMR